MTRPLQKQTQQVFLKSQRAAERRHRLAPRVSVGSIQRQFNSSGGAAEKQMVSAALRGCSISIKTYPTLTRGAKVCRRFAAVKLFGTCFWTALVYRGFLVDSKKTPAVIHRRYSGN
jgi:hypothetical protein